ncbi:MAG: hypothetical protein WB588_07425 [Dehalococcoidia bacterium]
MKLGIVFLVIGILLLITTIPYSIMSIVSSINELSQGNVSGGFTGTLLIIGVFLGFILISIGATEIFFRKKR